MDKFLTVFLVGRQEFLFAWARRWKSFVSILVDFVIIRLRTKKQIGIITNTMNNYEHDYTLLLCD